MAAWTLTYDGTTKTLEAWGVAANVSLTRRNAGLDFATLRVPGPCDGTVLFAYGEALTILVDAAVWFTGTVGTPQRVASGGDEAVEYRVNGAWWDLERLVFQQSWETYNGDPDALVSHYASELYLGQAPAGGAYDTGEQIEEVLDWAIAQGIALQKGTIDPAVTIPVQQVRDITCAEAIRMMLRWSPDVVTWFDYTTTPPTFHARKLSNLSSVSVTPPASHHMTALDLVPKHDMVVPAVLLRFKRINVVDGKSWVEITDQKYPSGATGLEPHALVATIDLAGIEGTNVFGEIVAEVCPAQTTAGDANVAWWKLKDPVLNSELIDNLAITSAEVKDADGYDVDLEDFPNELLDGSVAPWMNDGTDPISAVQVTIKATATYSLYAESGHVNLIKSGVTKELAVRVTLTNGVTGGYAALDSLTPAEPIPTGLAESLYNSLSVLQYEGRISLVGTEIPSGLAMGKKISLVLPGMTVSNLLVQGTQESPAFGRISLELGPAAHLGITDLIALLRVNRSRSRILNPSARATALAADQSSVELPSNNPRENATSGAATSASAAVVAAESGTNKMIVRMDASAKTFAMRVVDSEGADASEKARLLIDLASAYTGDSFEIREWEVCVGSPPVTKYARFISSAATDSPVME